MKIAMLAIIAVTASLFAVSCCPSPKAPPPVMHSSK